MEPVSSSILALTGMVIKGLELVHKRREGKLNEDEARQLYAKIFSSLLWEVKQNLDRCFLIKIKFEEENIISAGVLSFFVRESLFPDFCIMCPEPRVIACLNELYSAFERIHHWQRLTVNFSSENARFIIGYAKDMFEDKKLHDKYNDLILVLANLAPREHIPDQFKAITKS